MGSRVGELERLIEEAQVAYHVLNDPQVSDAVYDAWLDELKLLKSSSPVLMSVGATTNSEWVKIRHEIPMGSLDKVNTFTELVAWIHKLPTLPERLLVTEKLDGISVALQYENGKLCRAVTRGDGTTGDDITRNVCRMQGVQHTLPSSFSGQFRGEIVCTLSDLKEFFPDYSNPRNTAGGISNRLDGSGSEHLTVMVYHMLDGGHYLRSRDQQMTFITSLGFKTPNWFDINDVPGGVHTLWESYETSRRANLDYIIDGLVVEVNDLSQQLSLGDLHGRPKGAKAYKFSPPTASSTLRQIVCPTGGSGRRTPVAVFDEVDLLGTKVTNASLYNWKYIRDLKLDVGATILVARANDVIPRVLEVITETGTVASPNMICEACGQLSEWDGEYLVCQNTSNCSAQHVGRLLRYVKSLNILEWGEGVMERLVDRGLAEKVPDLYRLTKENLEDVDRMGEKSAKKLLDTLWGKNPVSMESFLGALSIPGCGESVITLVVDAGYDTLETIQTVTYEQLLSIIGLGPVRAKTLSQWFRTNWSLVTETLSAGLEIRERIKGNLSGKSFCFTGRTNRKRSDLEDIVRSAGGVVKDRVGKGLTYLVMSDPDSASSKAQAAKKHGTETISEATFLVMVQDNG